MVLFKQLQNDLLDRNRFFCLRGAFSLSNIKMTFWLEIASEYIQTLKDKLPILDSLHSRRGLWSDRHRRAGNRLMERWNKSELRKNTAGECMVSSSNCLEVVLEGGLVLLLAELRTDTSLRLASL
jgi:hypothetical protein